jgi:hypothetical protein
MQAELTTQFTMEAWIGKFMQAHAGSLPASSAASKQEVEWCNLAQALLWIHERREPVSEEDFRALQSDLPNNSRPYNALLLALRNGEIHARGLLVHMVEDVDPEHEMHLACPALPTCLDDWIEIRASGSVTPFLETTAPPKGQTKNGLKPSACLKIHRPIARPLPAMPIFRARQA